MEIVTIEKKTFELWQEKFNHFINHMDALCIPLRRKQDKWLDNCGKLPYSQINNKIYYKISDVETFMQNHVKNNSKK